MNIEKQRQIKIYILFMAITAIILMQGIVVSTNIFCTNNTISSLTETLETTTTTLETTTATLETTTASYNTLNNDYADLQTSHNTLTTELNELKNDYTELETELANTQKIIKEKEVATVTENNKSSKTVNNVTNKITSKLSAQSPFGTIKLNKLAGINYYNGHKETYYNLNMEGVVSIAKYKGIDYDYWVREDGVKMYGNYVMVGADYNIHPYGSIVETSLGTGIVLDTGDLEPYQFDIAVTW